MGKSSFETSRSSKADLWPYDNVSLPKFDLSELAVKSKGRFRKLSPDGRMAEVQILQLLIEQHPAIYGKLLKQVEAKPVAV